MPLIVEDGTGVVNANSYIGLVEARELAALRGITLSTVDDELTPQLIVAADRITAYESRFTGERVSGEQDLSYPRACSTRYGKSYPSTGIPKELKLAQVMIADYIESGFDVWATPGVEGIVREKVGPIETEYAQSVATDKENPYFAQIESILDPLFTPFGANFVISR